MTKKVQRNEPCPCGSGDKYKKCCAKKEQKCKRPHSFSLFEKTKDSTPALMKSFANRVCKVLSDTPFLSSKKTQKQSLPPPDQCCSSHDRQGCKTLEELIGLNEDASCSCREGCECSDKGKVGENSLRQKA